MEAVLETIEKSGSQRSTPEKEVEDDIQALEEEPNTQHSNGPKSETGDQEGEKTTSSFNAQSKENKA